MTESAIDMARRALSEAPKGLAVMTPSYLPDLPLFTDLHASVVRWFPKDTVHVAIVPTRDRVAFESLSSPQCRVLTVPEVLPGGFHGVPGANMWLSRRAPWPPVRGWIVQQLAKFGIADHIEADALIFADSDVVFVRPVNLDTFTDNGAVRFYRVAGTLHDSLPRHMIWTREAGRMLGLPVGEPPYDDYIFSPIAWDRRLVLATRRRIEEVTNRDWAVEMGRRLHLSECMLYGMFVNYVARSEHPAETCDMHSHTYWDEIPLDEEGLRTFVGGLRDSDIAIMLSAKSRTSPEARRAALSRAGII